MTFEDIVFTTRVGINSVVLTILFNIKYCFKISMKIFSSKKNPVYLHRHVIPIKYMNAGMNYAI